MIALSNRHKAAGFTLIEIALVLIIIASLAVVTSKFFFRDIDSETVDQTVDEIAIIQREALTYYAKNGEWPDQEKDCIGAISKFGGLNGTSPWYSDSGQIDYTTKCSANSGYKVFTVSLKLHETDKKYLEQLLIKLPLSLKNDAVDNKIDVSLPVPSSLAAKDLYIKRTKIDDTEFIDGEENQNTIGAGFNINGKLVDFQVGSCIKDDCDSERHRLAGDAIFSLDPSGISVLSELTLIPPSDSIVAPYDPTDPDHDKAFTLNLCSNSFYYTGNYDPDKTGLPDGSIPHKIDCVGEPRNPAWSIKVNDVFIRSDTHKQFVDQSGTPEGSPIQKNIDQQFLSQASSTMLRRWIHIKHWDVKKDWYDDIDKPNCGYIYDEASDKNLYYRPVIMIRSNGRIPDGINKFIRFDYYGVNYNYGKYTQWRIDIDIDQNNSLVELDEAAVSVDTFCFTDDKFESEDKEEEEEGEG